MQAFASRARRWSLCAVVGLAAAATLPTVAHAAELTATPATFGSVFGAAQSGDTVLLAAGNYGVFQGGAKPAPGVTIQPAVGVTRAQVTMALNFQPASGITVQGVSLTEVDLNYAATRNITIRGSDFIGNARAVIRTKEFNNNNVLLDGNRHVGQNVCAGCYDARVHLPERNESAASGVTIRNSYFAGGNADGIQNGSNGTVIEGNEFADQVQGDGSVAHTDAIQLYGSKNTVIRGNWFHEVAAGIMCADQCDHETVTGNIFKVTGSPYAVTWLSDDGSVFTHNTFWSAGTCDYGARCGRLYLGNKSVDPVSRGTIVRDNILNDICVCDGTVQGTSDVANNVFVSSPQGTNSLTGTPTYVGGANPTTRAGFQLASGSLGKGNASDGTDRGANLSGAPIPDPIPITDPITDPIPIPIPIPIPDPIPDPTPTPTNLPARAIWTAPDGVRVERPTTLDGTASTGDGPLTCEWTFENADGSTIWDTATGCELPKTFTSVGRKYVRLTVTDKDGDTNASKQTFWVG